MHCKYGNLSISVLVAISSSQSLCAPSQNEWDDMMAVDPALPLQLIQSAGLLAADRCVAVAPTKEVSIRQAYANWRYSKYKVETRVNGKIVDSESGF